MGALLLKNHGSVVTGTDIARVCVTAHRLEKVAETMLHAASLVRLPVMSPQEKATVLQAREAVDSALRGSLDQERWQMLQDYHLGT
jgi:ribulose-5-phosphate 4-epimerase/fuculose-1-phosphate aldolase